MTQFPTNNQYKTKTQMGLPNDAIFHKQKYKTKTQMGFPNDSISNK